MKPYSLLMNIEKRVFINSIKSIIGSPKRLITYILYIAFMTWVILMNVKNVGSASTSDQLATFGKYFQGGAFILILFISYALLKQSSMSFRMSEINLLFTAPIDSRKLLLFNVFKRIPVYLMTSLYTLIFILSIMIRMYQPTFVEILCTCIGYTFVLLILEPMSFCLFVISTKIKKEDFAERAVKVFFILISLIALIPVAINISKFGFSLEVLFDGLGSKYLNMIPVIGWGRYLTITVIEGLNLYTLLALAGMVTMYIVFLFITYKLGDDYYEDVIHTSEERSQKIKEYKSGKSNIKSFQLKKKRITTTKFKTGAGALDWKRQHMLKRTDFSAFLSMETLLCLVIAVGSILFVKDPEFETIYVATGIYFYIKFLFSMETELDRELKKPYYYLIPDSAMKKMLNIVKVDLLRFLINTSIIAAISSFSGFKIEYLLLPLTVTSLYTVMILSSYLFNLFLPSEDFKRMMLMFKMLQMILLLLPSIIVMIIIGVTTESIALTLLGSFLVNMIISGIMLALSEGLFARLELK